MRVLYSNGKWDGIWDNPKYEEIRNKIKNTFSELVFIEEGHKYFLHGKQMTCVSDVTHMFQEHFDSTTKAVETSERNFNNPDSKYYQMTPEQILAEWKKISNEACTTGTFRHEFGESAFYYMTGQYDKILEDYKDRLTDDGGFVAYDPKEEAVVRFYEDIPRSIVPILAETKVYDEELGYSGTFDILFYYDAELDGKTGDKSGLVVMDWKGLDITTPIFTLNKGWQTMGSVEVGDVVYDKMGMPTKILHTSTVHNKKCYKVKFDNNVEIIADYDHRWEITYGGYNKNKVDIMTTEELFNYCNKIKGHRIQGTIPRVVINKPLISSNNDFEIDPYVFGVWLGDGHSSCGMVTNMYDEIFDEITKRGFTVGNDVSQGGAGKAKTKTIHGLRTLLNKYNLLNNKHLPKEVIVSSFEYKKNVLGGLMDTDGYYHPSRKRFVISTSRPKQVEFCVHLLSSMGIKSTVIKNHKKINDKKIQCYDVTFTCDFNPFFRRKINVDFPKQNNHSFSNVKEVTECDTVPTRCIEVDSPTHTFLYGNHFMVTHNTNKDLYKNFRGKTLLTPFNELLDMPLSIYKLQLSLYQSCLEKIGMKVIARRILWLKPEGIYDKINLEEYVYVLREELKNKNLTPRNHE